MNDKARQADPNEGGERASYEFSDRHKESFASLAGSVIFLGVCALLLSAVSVMGALGALAEGYPTYAAAAAGGVVVCGLTAVWMLSAGRSLSGIVRTRGRDVELLMQAVGQLRRLLVLVMLVTLLLVAVGMVALWCAATGGKCLGVFS